MTLLWRWFRRGLLVLILLIVGLAAPIVYVETSCQGKTLAGDYTPLIAPDYRRPESRTLMTYPEWHIVHAYDDYAKVISTGDPHDYAYLESIRGY